MPNWCQNTITVDGKEEHRREFVAKNKGFAWEDSKKEREYFDLTFDAGVPIPLSIRNAKKGDKWYGWCNKNWGTKWDAREPYVAHDVSETTYHFETAWSFPTEWLQKVSRKYPQLLFKVKWVEESGYGGFFEVIDGECFEGRTMSDTEAHKEFYGDDEE